MARVSVKGALALAAEFEAEAAKLRASTILESPTATHERILANAQADIWTEAAAKVRGIITEKPNGDEP